jgi:hypothetical protein
MARRTVANALSEIDKRLDADATLSEETRAQIKAKAREHVEKKRRDKAEAELLAKEIREIERSYNPAEQFEDVVIDLAPYAAFISIDGELFYHGVSYSRPWSVARTLDDLMARTWEHQNEIGGHRRKGDLNRRPANRRISPHDAGAAPSAINTRASVLSPDASI